MSSRPRPERLSEESQLLLVLAMAQFVSIIDFMIVMPLGPDFAAALHIDLSHLGWVGGAYTLAAAVTGVLAAVHLDRFDRRLVMLISLIGLGTFTALAGFAWNFETLVAARFMSGAFGGPSGAICYAIVADTIPAGRRGAAMGKVMGAGAFASVLGVPFGLELARAYGWAMPFYASSVCILIVVGLTLRFMPSMTGHMVPSATVRSLQSLRKMLFSRLNAVVFLYVGLGSFSAFLIIPNLAAYVQFNLGFPREQLGLMYMAGGATSFIILRIAGQVVDRTQASVVSAACACVLAVLFYFGIIAQPVHLPVIAIYILFMMGSSLRNVSNNTLASKIPEARQRAGFLALMSSTSQVAAALGAFTSGLMLSEGAGKQLLYFDRVAWLGMATSAAVPLLMWWVERHVRLRDKAAALITPPEASI